MRPFSSTISLFSMLLAGHWLLTLSWMPMALPVVLVTLAGLRYPLLKEAITQNRKAFFALTLLLGYLALTSLWHYQPSKSWELWPRLAIMFYAFALVWLTLTPATVTSFTPTDVRAPSLRQSPLFWLFIATFLAYLLSVWVFPYIQNMLGPERVHTLDRFSPGSGLIVLLIWPWLYYLKYAMRTPHDFKYFVLTVAAVAFILCQQNMAAAIAGLIISVFTFGAVKLFPRFMSYWAGIKMIISLWMAPWLALKFMTPEVLGSLYDRLPFSWQHRLHIWHFVSHKIMEKFWFGWGLNSARYFPGGKEDYDVGRALLPMHPHNLFMQIWLDFGVVGALLGSLGIAWIAYRLAQQPKQAPYLAGIAAGYVGVELFSFSIWQSWWVAGTLLTFLLWKYIRVTTSEALQ